MLQRARLSIAGENKGSLKRGKSIFEAGVIRDWTEESNRNMARAVKSGNWAGGEEESPFAK